MSSLTILHTNRTQRYTNLYEFELRPRTQHYCSIWRNRHIISFQKQSIPAKMCVRFNDTKKGMFRWSMQSDFLTAENITSKRRTSTEMFDCWMNQSYIAACSSLWTRNHHISRLCRNRIMWSQGVIAEWERKGTTTWKIHALFYVYMILCVAFFRSVVKRPN